MSTIIFMMMAIIYVVNPHPSFKEFYMRVTRQAMDTGHQRIVDGAARLFRERGVRGTSVADAMSAAGLTHGGFYRHFGSKDDLVVQATRRMFDEFATPLETRQQHESAAKVVAEFKAMYLSDEHIQNPACGCPMPAMGADIARESDPLQSEFAAGLNRVIDAMRPGMPVSANEQEAAAVREICMLVGAVLLARACDVGTARRVLEGARSESAHRD